MEVELIELAETSDPKSLGQVENQQPRYSANPSP